MTNKIKIRESGDPIVFCETLPNGNPIIDPNKVLLLSLYESNEDRNVQVNYSGNIAAYRMIHIISRAKKDPVFRSLNKLVDDLMKLPEDKDRTFLLDEENVLLLKKDNGEVQYQDPIVLSFDFSSSPLNLHYLTFSDGYKFSNFRSYMSRPIFRRIVTDLKKSIENEVANKDGGLK